MSNNDKYDGNIIFKIEPLVKRKYHELCEDKGSNVSVELRKYVYAQLKENNK